MKRTVIRDLKRWNKYLISETKIKLLKSLICNSNIDSNQKSKASFILNKKFKNFSKTKIINWCIITGRGHSILRSFWLSRMQFKEYASQGIFPGVKWRNY